MTANEAVDIRSHAFALRLANLLVATRTRDGRGVGSMARASGGTFSRRDLKAFEHAERTLDEATLDELGQLYRCDLGVILPVRLPVEVTAHRVSAGGVHQDFASGDSDTVLAAYLTLVRTLRHQRRAPVVDLRRDDIEVLAGFLAQPSQTVVERLATLMNATQSKRTAMLGVFATGAAVVGLVGTALAVGGSSTTPVDNRPDSSVTTTTTTEVAGTTTEAVSVATTTATTAPPTTAPPTTAATVPGTKPVTRPAATTTTGPPFIDTDLPTTVVDVGPPPLP